MNKRIDNLDVPLEEFVVEEQVPQTAIVQTDVSTPSTMLQNSFNDVIGEKLVGSLTAAVQKKEDKINELADAKLDAEITKAKQHIKGDVAVDQEKLNKHITEAQTETEEAKHKQVRTILTSQGITKPVPSVFRKTAIIIGYPFFLIYVLTVGAVLSFVSFCISGFIHLVAMSVETFVEVSNKKEYKDFDVKQYMAKTLRWVVIVILVVAAFFLLRAV